MESESLPCVPNDQYSRFATMTSTFRNSREDLSDSLFSKAKKNRHPVNMVVAHTDVKFHEKAYYFKTIALWTYIIITIYAIVDRFVWNPWHIEIRNPMKKNWPGTIFSVFAWISGRSMMCGVNIIFLAQMRVFLGLDNRSCSSMVIYG
eukprot:UN32390